MDPHTRVWFLVFRFGVWVSRAADSHLPLDLEPSPESEDAFRQFVLRVACDILDMDETDRETAAALKKIILDDAAGITHYPLCD